MEIVQSILSGKTVRCRSNRLRKYHSRGGSQRYNGRNYGRCPTSGKTETVFFYALAPDKTGTYNVETEIGYLDNGIYDSSQSLRKEIAAKKDSAQMVSDVIRALKSLMVSKKDKWELEDAIQHMESVQRGMVVTVRDIQRNIDDIMEALDSLLSITSTDVSRIRLMMDALLETWKGKLILFPS